MKRYKGNDYFYTERGFDSIIDADSYATLLRKQEPDYGWYLFEQSKHYGNGEDKNASARGNSCRNYQWRSCYGSI